MFDAQSIQERLAPRLVRCYPQAGSTNDIALDWLNAGAPAGAVVITNEQVQGRGRQGRTWHTPAGTALTFSVVLRPPAEHLRCVTMLGALAICELLDHLGADDVGIKWPNDVHLRGRKVSGVLPEAVWDGGRLSGVVLGIGVNMSIDFAGTELAQTAGSIEPILGKAVDRLEALAFVLARIDAWSSALGSAALFEGWKGRLNTLGRQVAVGAVKGVAEAVDDDGALLVRDAAGRLHRVVAGDIALG